jgi:HEAT repeat protein
MLIAGAASEAVETDRIALEQLAGETPLDVALAYQDACFRIGVTPAGVSPLQAFDHGGTRFVRIAVAGPGPVLRCLNGVSGRDAIDGTIHWLDGSAAGLLRSSRGAADVRVPDHDWYALTTPLVTFPPVDNTLVQGLASGAADARQEFAALPLDAALIQLGALAARGGPEVLAVLEKLAGADTRSPVRRRAVMSLDPTISAATILDRALHDTAWQVRLAAVEQLGRLATSPSPRAADGVSALLQVATSDADWTVQRRAIWALSSAMVRDAAASLHALASRPSADARVRAVALESLAGAHVIERDEITRALVDPAPEVRAIGAELLAAQMGPGDAPALWRALNDPDRLVRLATAPFLDHIDDPTIAPALWRLYQSEAVLVDADSDFERSILGALARHPDVVVADAMKTRLMEGPLPPDERRLLSRTLAAAAPAMARGVLEPWLASPDPHLRSVAADAAPDSPAVHDRRVELLGDPDSDVRAGALLGLCRASLVPLNEIADKIDLARTPLGDEASAAAARCGAHAPQVTRLRTYLAGPPPPGEARQGGGSWAAIVAIVLLIVSVLGVKLGKPTGGAPVG